MHACLASVNEDQALRHYLESAATPLGLKFWQAEGAAGPQLSLTPQYRKALRSASVLIATLTGSARLANSILYDIGIAQTGKVPILIIKEDDTGAELTGSMLSEIPPENVFVRSSEGFDQEFAARLREIVHASPPIKNAPDGTAAPVSYDVFISYSEKDKARVLELREFLKKHGIKFWDYDATPRDYDVHFVEEIERAIKNSRVFLCVLTRNWRGSDWAKSELTVAQQIKKPYFLLAFEQTNGCLWANLRTTVNCIDNRDEGFNKMLDRLDILLSEETTR